MKSEEYQRKEIKNARQQAINPIAAVALWI